MTKRSLPTLMRLAAAKRDLPGGFLPLPWLRQSSVAETGKPLRTSPLSSFASAMTSPTGGERPRDRFRVDGAPPALVEQVAAYQPVPISPPRGSVAMLRRAVVTAGVVRMSDGSAVAESLVNTEEPDPTFPFRRVRGGLASRAEGVVPVREFARGTYVLLKQYFDSNYGHWLVEALPRLALVEDHFDLSEATVVVSAGHGAMQDVYRDSLALAGIPPDRIVEVGIETCFFDRLVYPAPITRHPWHIAPRCVEFLERLAASVPRPTPGPDRVYVSRSRAAKRRLLEEDAFRRLAERRGFVVLDPEGMSLAGQVAAFADAGTVVGVGGAGLTNVAFARRGCGLLSLSSEWMRDDFFPTLVALKGGTYSSIHGKAVDPSAGYHSDFSLDGDAFARRLDEFLEERRPQAVMA